MRRWTIIYPETRQYTAEASGRTKGIGWTHDLALARLLCSGGGVVVDADWFSRHWHLWARDGAIPPEALPPERKGVSK